MNDTLMAVEIKVYGKVQGVYYRAATLDKASELGVKGYVRNLPDKSVEIIAQADQDKLDALIEWCHTGPKNANVEKVSITHIKVNKPFDQFVIKRV